MKCFNCGEQIREGARFCPFCGQDQSKKPEEALCPNCQQPLEPDAKFCTGCGHALSQPETVAEQPPVEVPAAEEEPVQTPVEEVPAQVEEVAAEEVIEEAPAVEPAPAPVAQPAPAPEAEPAPAPAAQPIPVPQSVPAPAPAPQSAPQVTYPQPSTRPALQLPNRRGMWKMILLSLVTFGIYPMVIWSRISMEINMVASRYDGKRTIHFMWVPFLSALTLCVYAFVWIHGLCNRIGDELIRRGIRYKFSASTFWLWNLLYPLIGAAITVALVVFLPKLGLDLTLAYLAYGAMTFVSIIGPFVYLHKNMKAMNLINTDYNEKG